MLEGVISELAAAFAAAGLEAVRAYPRQELRGREKSLVCVSVLSVKGLPAGFGGYLGLETDPVTGLSEELYGVRCQLELGLDIYAAAGARNGPCECLRCAELIAPALKTLPEGLRPSSLKFGPAAPDAETGRFLCRGVLACSAHFTARTKDEDGEFTDFILRGSVKR